MIVDKRKYHSSFKDIMKRYYTVLKEVGDVPKSWEGYFDGYVDAGILLGITSTDELNKIIEESNYKIFGMTIEERRNKFKTKKKVDENDLDSPTFIREGKLLEF